MSKFRFAWFTCFVATTCLIVSTLQSASAATSTALPKTGVVKGFDEANVSAGLGNGFTQAQWISIRKAGFRVFITDPISWGSECSDGDCTRPVNKCTLDARAVAQIQYAYQAGLNYAIYTRNANCLTKAIKALSVTLQKNMSFVVFDIETGPSASSRAKWLIA